MRNAAGGSCRSFRVAFSASPIQARSSSITPKVTASPGVVGLPSLSNAAATNGTSVGVRTGTASVSTMIWARCSTALAPAVKPRLYPMNATGLRRKRNDKNTESIAFFSTAGRPRLYSGVTIT